MQIIQQLAKRGILSDSDVARAADAVAAAADKAPHLTLIEKGFVKEDILLPILAEEFGMEWVDLTQTKVEAEALVAVPLKLLHRKNLMPIARHNGTLTVATGDPYDAYAIDELNTLMGLHIHPVLGSPKEITRLIKIHFGVGGDTVSSLVEDRKSDIEFLDDMETDDSELAKQAQEASVVQQ